MTESIERPDNEKSFKKALNRIDALERWRRRFSNIFGPETVFTLAGPLYISESTDYPVRNRRSYEDMSVRLKSALTSGTLTLVVKRNGVVERTFTINPGISKLKKVPLGSLKFDAEEDLCVGLTSVGVGGTGITVAMRGVNL